jgi:hypothetical protein
MAAEKRGDLVAIAAGRHGTPATAVRARVIVEKETASGIRATANRSSPSFDEKVGGRTGDGGEQPLEPALASNELKRPCTLAEDKFVVSLGDAEKSIDRFHPGGREGISFHNASEDGPERFAKTKGAEKDSVDREGLGRKKRAKTRGAILGDQASIDEKSDKLVPGETVCRRGEVGEIEGETAGDELSRVVRRRRCWGQHITSVEVQNGYIRMGVTRKCKDGNFAEKVRVFSSN